MVHHYIAERSLTHLTETDFFVKPAGFTIFLIDKKTGGFTDGRGTLDGGFQESRGYSLTAILGKNSESVDVEFSAFGL